MTLIARANSTVSVGIQNRPEWLKWDVKLAVIKRRRAATVDVLFWLLSLPVRFRIRAVFQVSGCWRSLGSTLTRFTFLFDFQFILTTIYVGGDKDRF
ncbi:hypothetical protein RRG08_059037 [Elysia crispata]|uniref:Uncharacterized protein n=1 Tax=Elysia crispata TaxID=231223 RepID=A0AAE0ZDQ8_9GAST|nr:hypothetical protein RRG08_059037 [Elysia crispata]